MKKLQNFKANNLTEDQMRKVIGGKVTSYSGNGSGSDTASGGETHFDSGPAAGSPDTKDPNTGR